jgi:hypothetical protein
MPSLKVHPGCNEDVLKRASAEQAIPLTFDRDYSASQVD